MQKTLPYVFGDAARARYDFLLASFSKTADETGHNPVGVNRRHCRPLHPHGMRLVKEGLMTLGRDVYGWSNTSRTSYVTITPKGVDELIRLQKILDRKGKRNAGRT
jgi:hypothetical protein